jgi:lysophospholipase L1-like esterase
MAVGYRLALALVVAALWVDVPAADAARSPRLKRIVAVGDSVLAGYSSDGFVERGPAGQVHSAPRQFARRARARFRQPLMDRPGVPPPYRIVDRDGDGVLEPGDLVRPAEDLGFREEPDRKVRNLAVPGEDIASVFEGIRPEEIAQQLLTGSVEGRDILKFLILGLPLRDEAVSQVSRARELRPTLLLVWIGNNDLLAMGTSTDPTRIDRPAAEFGRLFRRLLDELAGTGADMAVANLPDVTGIALLRRAAGEVTQCRRGDGALEPVAADDRISIAMDPARLPTPPCSEVLSAVERDQARANVAAFNAEIAAAVAEVSAARGVGIALVDTFALFDRLATAGVDLGGDGVADVSAGYLGGVFSLDGVHPTRTANALIANAFIDAVNAQFGEAIPPIDVARVAARDPHVGSPYRPAGEPPFGLLEEVRVDPPFEDSYDRIEEGAEDLARDFRRGVRDVFDFFEDLGAAR